MKSTLIPGVYTSYELSGVRYVNRGAGAVGLVWKGSANDEKPRVFTSVSQVAAVYGKTGSLTKHAKLIFGNGASVLKTVSVKTDYEAGFEMLMQETDVNIMTCDSEDTTVHASMLNCISKGREETKYRIGIVGGGGNYVSLCVQAKSLNNARMVLVSGAECAMAFAGLVSGTEDPALPYNGAELYGVEEEFVYTDEDINAMLLSGVTPIQTIGGVCEIVRAVTTKTETDGVPDSTWRDINTILITDYVIPQVRAVLKAMFTRAKNTERTRGAVRTQVVIELDKMVDMGIIEYYGNVSAVKSAEDPAVCEVTFEFAVAGGMHQIIIAAGIIV